MLVAIIVSPEPVAQKEGGGRQCPLSESLSPRRAPRLDSSWKDGACARDLGCATHRRGRRTERSEGTANADRLEELEQVGTFACGNGEGSQKAGNQGDVRDRIGAQIASVEKEESRATTRKVRAELALSRNLEKEKSIETSEAPGQDQGECRDGEGSQENAEQAFQLEINRKRRKSRICSHKILPRPILTLSGTEGVNPIRETTLGGAVEKHENRLCWWNVDLAKEAGKRLEKAEEREKVTGSDHSRCFESITARMFGKAGEVAVVDVLEHAWISRKIGCVR